MYPPLAGLIGLHVIPLTHRWALVGCSFLQFIIGVQLSCVGFYRMPMCQGLRKTIANGIWFVMYAAGNIISPNIFYAREAPKYRSGIIGLISSYCGIMVLAIAIRLVFMHRNRKRNLEQGGYNEQIAEQAVLDGFKGLTDFENAGFRYSL